MWVESDGDPHSMFANSAIEITEGVTGGEVTTFHCGDEQAERTNGGKALLPGDTAQQTLVGQQPIRTLPDRVG